MYVPKYAAVTDAQILRQFIEDHAFGTLVTPDMNANHYPFLVNEENGELVLYTHLARSNPQWKDIDNSSCLAIFTGPHRYISPVHYKNKMNVPTWSYTAVHVKCTASLVSDEKLAAELMKKLVAHYEGKNKTNWDYNLPQDFHDGLMKAIVWIKFKVNNLEGKFKLSQNRDQTDYDSLRAQLMKDESDNTKGLLKYMNLTNPHT